jgi:uroporphyrin-3 C-methyltransferase
VVDNSDTPKILEEISRAGAKGNSRPRNQKKARRRLFVVTSLLVPILITTCYLGFQLYELRQEFAILNYQHDALSNIISNQKSQLEALATEVDEYSSSGGPGQSLIENIRMMNLEIEELKARVLIGPSESESYWHIREAEFLLSLANRKLALEKDINSSIGLIEDVDSTILASGYQGVISLRESLARVLMDLRAIEQVDEQGVFIRIELMRALVEDMEVRGLKIANNGTSGSFKELGETENPDMGLNSIINILSNIFVWREWDDASDLILMTDARMITKQRLHLLLEQAQLGLISKNEAVYEQSLLKAKELLVLLAAEHSVLGQSIMIEIDDLAAINIDPTGPQLEESLKLMNELASRLQDLR